MTKFGANKVKFTASGMFFYSIKKVVFATASRTVFRVVFPVDNTGKELDCYFSSADDGADTKFFDKNLKEIKFYNSHGARIYPDDFLDHKMKDTSYWTEHVNSSWKKEKLPGSPDTI
jgi:hypothetical protein